MPFIGDTGTYSVVTPAAGDTVPIVQGGALKQAYASELAGTAGMPGFRYLIDAGSTTASDPGAGRLRFNNATQASATEIYLDNSTDDGVSLATYLAALGVSGWVHIVKTADPETWHTFTYTNLVDSAGYRTITVASQAKGADFADIDAVVVLFQSRSNDSDDVTYTPTTLADWDGSADPGDVEQALDQLAERVTDVEGASGNVATDAIWDAAGDLVQGTGANTAARLALGTALQVLRVNAGATAVEWGTPTGGDADDVTYTPTTVADWDGSADPGDVEQALDQLAERVTDLEGAGGGGSFFLSGDAMDSMPTPSNAATLFTLSNGTPCLQYDGGSTNESARWKRQLSPDFTGSTIDIVVVNTMTSATSGNVRWGARVMRQNADLTADSFDTAVEAHTAVAADADDLTTTVLSAVSVDGAVAGEEIIIEIYRDASDTTNDTATGYAELQYWKATQ
jgi:hypothetical protein